MNLGIVIHCAIDYFFCDRCPIEVIDTTFSDMITHICPFARIWAMNILPIEEFNKNHPVLFPRTYLLRLTQTDRGLQVLGPDKYNEQ